MDKKLKNYRHELFCNLYARDRECIGNVTKSYIAAYGLKNDSYRSANKNSFRLMVNEGILRRIDYLFNKLIDSKVVDTELAFICMQRDDLRSKVAAICEFNRLRGRITEKLGGKFIFSWEKEE